MLTPIDLVVLAVYGVGVVAFGLIAGGRQRTATDYFLGGRDLPWWAVSFSIVATETSTLTVIGVPAVAYGGAMTFLQLAIGYIIGRIVVAAVMLPRYFRGEQATAYEFLGQRFGGGMRALASVTFLLTRLLADGVRLFATAIPIRVILLAAGYDVSYGWIVVAIGVVTAAYTYVGGLRAVVWMDVVQMGVYVGGAIFALVLLWPSLSGGGFDAAAAEGKLQILDLALPAQDTIATLLTSPYAFLVAVIGGILFSMASHGADQLIVQRVLACRSLAEGRRAMVWSGLLVAFQFALFLAVGLGLWAFYGGQAPDALGLSRGDEVFPMFILDEMPVGIRGLLVAGIVAAAMSTLSSSLNALAGSTLMDLVDQVAGVRPDPEVALKWSRWLTLVWAAVFVGFALLFEDTQNPVVELGLGIAGFTYGGLLGAFLLGLWSRRARQLDAMIAFVIAIVTMTFIIFGVFWASETGQWVVDWRPTAEAREALGLKPVAWPLYPLIGTTLTVGLGLLFGLRHRTGAAEKNPHAAAP